MWIIAAPAASHAVASAAISSGVVGSCGTSSLRFSAPVGATVIIVVPGRARNLLTG